MIIKPKAPAVTSLEISKLSANHVNLTWDNVGSNFYYLIDIMNTKDANGNIVSTQWTSNGYVSKNYYFTSQLLPSNSYKIRIAVAAENFEQSDWVETEEFLSFPTNVYNFELLTPLNLITKFIQEKFQNNNNSYINFTTDTLNAALMAEDFIYSPYYENISSIKNYIITDDEYHELQGGVTKICKDIERVYLMEEQGILYLFERYQNIVKVSNDKGQTWQAVKLLTDRVGYPLSKTVHYQSANTAYVLGYSKIFYGRRSSDIRWSADDVKMSSQDVTFAKIGDQLNLGFDVDIFGTYTTLPGEISTKAEAMTASNDFVYVVARDTVRKIKTNSAPIDTDATSPTFGEKLFEEGKSYITGNSKSVCYKMDSVLGHTYALIIGEVYQEKQDPRNINNINQDSELKGVYKLDPETDTWTRVFGNTSEERRRIEYGYTSMSANQDEVFISSSNFKMIEDFIVEDPNLPLTNPDVTYAVQYAPERQYIHDKSNLMMSFRTNEKNGWDTFKPGRMKYYAEPFFSKNTHSNTQCWINNSNQVVVVYSDVVYQKILDKYGTNSPSRVSRETWVDGVCTVTMPDVNFSGFNQYASGIMFYNGADGNLVAFYEFNYRVKDNIDIVWKPKQTFLTATLQNQVHDTTWAPEDTDKIKDPNLTPFLKNIVPDAYLLEESNFEKFCEYYIAYISEGYGSHYNNLLNLIKNKYPREEHSWQYLWSEVYKRNIYLDREKRDQVSRFFETRKNDFYSAKGTEASYKFLFKVLYNEEVEIDIESNNTNEYHIVIESDNVTEDLIGKPLYTETGRANVTYIEREYQKGKLRWSITIHNMIGRFIEGQIIKSEDQKVNALIVTGIKAKELSSENIDYINRGRSYYTMRIKSTLPTSRYRDDVLRFVHPVGFGFIGITLLTMFINSGLSLRHVETIINKYKNYRWSDGLPLEYPDLVAVLDAAGNIQKDVVTGEATYVDGPYKGIPYPLPDSYNDDNGNSVISGQNPNERRKLMSPLFDQSAVGFAQWRDLIHNRLKANINNPRDPLEPSQIKVE